MPGATLHHEGLLGEPEQPIALLAPLAPGSVVRCDSCGERTTIVGTAGNIKIAPHVDKHGRPCEAAGEDARYYDERNLAMWRGPALRFDNGVGTTGDVKVGVWDRGATFGEGPRGLKQKDGEPVFFTADTFKTFVENWFARGGRLALSLDHSSALGGMVAAPAAAFYDAFAVVKDGAIVHFRALGGSKAQPPALEELKASVQRFATESDPEPSPDGLWGFRCEVTPLGAHPTKGLRNYAGISPLFVMHGTDEQERPIGPVMFDWSAVNVPFQAGCELFARVPAAGARRMAASANTTDATAMAATLDSSEYRAEVERALQSAGLGEVRITECQVNPRSGRRNLIVSYKGMELDVSSDNMTGAEVARHVKPRVEQARAAGFAAPTAGATAMGGPYEVDRNGATVQVGDLVVCPDGRRRTIKHIGETDSPYGVPIGTIVVSDGAGTMKLRSEDIKKASAGYSRSAGAVAMASDRDVEQAAIRGGQEWAQRESRREPWPYRSESDLIRAAQQAAEQAFRSMPVGGAGGGSGVERWWHDHFVELFVSAVQTWFERNSYSRGRGATAMRLRPRKAITMTQLLEGLDKGAVAMGPGDTFKVGDRIEVKVYDGRWLKATVRHVTYDGDIVFDTDDGMKSVTEIGESKSVRKLGAGTSGAVAFIARDGSGLPLSVGDPVIAEGDTGTVAAISGTTITVKFRDGSTSNYDEDDREVIKIRERAFAASTKGATAMAGETDKKTVCPNCQQWQYPTKDGYRDCSHECARRGFAPKVPVKMIANTSGVRRFDKGNPMDETQMAAHFGWAPDDDDKTKLAKCLAKFAAGDQAQEQEHADTLREVADQEQAEADQMGASVMVRLSRGDAAALRTLRAMSGLRGADLPAIVAAVEAKRVDASAFGQLQGEVTSLRQQLEAVNVERATVKAKAFAQQAIADGRTLAEKQQIIVDAFVAAEKAKADSGAAAVEPLLFTKGTFTLGRPMTANGAPIGKPERENNFAQADGDDVAIAFTNKAKEIAKRDGIAFTAAAAKVQAESPEVYAAYKALRR